MQTRPVDPAFEARLKRDLAVLATLAELGSADIHHLHALCFPTCVAATARLGLANLLADGYLTHSRWRLKRAKGEGGYVWTITPKGLARLHHYGLLPDRVLDIDLGRPSTAVECDEWCVRMDVCTLIAALILEARRSAFLTSLRVTTGYTWPTLFSSTSARQPDVILEIGWHAPTAKRADWLPWLERSSAGGQLLVQYVVYLDRSAAPFPVQWLHDAPRSATAARPCIPVIVLHSEERYRLAQREIKAAGYWDDIRLSTWEALRTGIGAKQWRDNQGRPCALRP